MLGLKICAQYNIDYIDPFKDFLNNVVSALIAYRTFEKKPGFKIEHV